MFSPQLSSCGNRVTARHTKERTLDVRPLPQLRPGRSQVREDYRKVCLKRGSKSGSIALRMCQETVRRTDDVAASHSACRVQSGRKDTTFHASGPVTAGKECLRRGECPTARKEREWSKGDRVAKDRPAASLLRRLASSPHSAKQGRGNKNVW